MQNLTFIRLFHQLWPFSLALLLINVLVNHQLFLCRIRVYHW